GLTTTFLRSLSHGDTSDGLRVDRCHELVARTAAVPRTGVWCESSVLPEIVSLAAPHEPKDGRDWERTNWWNEVAEWIRRCLGVSSSIEMIQLRAWPSSAVLRVHSAEHVFYFKAVAPSIARAFAL